MTQLKLMLALSSVLIMAASQTIQTSGVTVRLRGVSAVSDRVAWASGAGSTVLRTADGGDSWQKLVVASDQLDFRDIDAIDAQTAYVLSIGNGPASRIYKTTDAGATWTQQFRNEDPNAFYDAMSFWDADHGIVIGDSIAGQFCVMTTEDGGRTWRRVPAGALPAALPNEGAFAASGTNIAVLGKSDAWIATGAATKARVLRTHDRGRSWTIAETPLASGPSAGIFSIAFRDAKHGVVVGGDYTKEKETGNNLGVTSDGGDTWTLVKGLSGFRSVVAYLLDAGKPALIAIGPAGADLSWDDGSTWKQLEGPGYDTVSFARNQTTGGPTAWATGAGGRIGRLKF
jgi:photosystem II stability/assembly factor-like uncharacterized protein